MMDTYSGKYLDTLVDGDLLFLLKADVQLQRGTRIFINTVPFKVHAFEPAVEGLVVRVVPVEDPF